jgi:hypothetical protein
LDPLKAGMDTLRQSGHGRRLSQSRDTFDQQVAVAQQPDQHAVHELPLADDHPANFSHKPPTWFAAEFDCFGELFDLVVNGTSCRCGHRGVP